MAMIARHEHERIPPITAREEGIIKECLVACIEIFDGWEFEILFGITVEELREIANAWPSNKQSHDVFVAVNNSLILLLSYPGIWNEADGWCVYISASRLEVSEIFDKMHGKAIGPKIYDRESLIQHLSKEAIDFVFFWGHQSPEEASITKSCFSLWSLAWFAIDKTIYRSAGHYMVAEKARLFNDAESLEQILRAETAKEAKTLGRQIKNFDEALWNEKRFDIVLKGNKAKFRQNMAGFLKTMKGSVIVEASPTDNVWGIGLAADHPDAKDPRKWRGLNLLGFILMRVRDEI